jgi:hypothetical protein
MAVFQGRHITTDSPVVADFALTATLGERYATPMEFLWTSRPTYMIVFSMTCLLGCGSILVDFNIPRITHVCKGQVVYIQLSAIMANALKIPGHSVSSDNFSNTSKAN